MYSVENFELKTEKRSNQWKSMSKKYWNCVRRNWEACGGIFDIDKRKGEIKALEDESAKPDFWNDQERAQRILQSISTKRKTIDEWESLNQQCDDLVVLFQLAEEEEDSDTIEEVRRSVEKLSIEIEGLELKSTLSDEDDPKSALLEIHSGAGGTEAQDWAEMLMRMYLRWSERSGYETEIMDTMPGEEAGIKSTTIEVRGAYAYGYLKAEKGVHRLVRISPFDANRRRHTSFASVFVLPEVEEDIEIEVTDNDLRIDTFRASGAGGQHVNKVSSAVRITHLPTGIVAQCQSERSQHRNRENAMKILLARLYQYYKEKEEKKQAEKEKAEKKKIEWGSQIRSYVFHPYNMVKDHRTGIETGDTQGVMDGDLDRFITGYLHTQRES
jgi:peptide chain release factor 2